MQQVLNPFVSIYQTQLEASRRFADAVFSGTQRIDEVVISATQRAFNEQLNLANAMMRDPRTVGSTLQSSFLSANPSDAANYQREIMAIFSEMQNEIGRSFHEYFQQLGAQAPTGISRVNETVRQSSDSAVNPVTSMFSVWESAFKEVAALAKKNMTAAQSTAHDVATHNLQNAGNYADVMSRTARAGVSTMDNVASATAHATRSATANGESASDEKRGSGGNGKRK
jgi:hypothetical protein